MDLRRLQMSQGFRKGLGGEILAPLVPVPTLETHCANVPYAWAGRL